MIGVGVCDKCASFGPIEVETKGGSVHQICDSLECGFKVSCSGAMHDTGQLSHGIC